MVPRPYAENKPLQEQTLGKLLGNVQLWLNGWSDRLSVPSAVAPSSGQRRNCAGSYKPSNPGPAPSSGKRAKSGPGALGMEGASRALTGRLGGARAARARTAKEGRLGRAVCQAPRRGSPPASLRTTQGGRPEPSAPPCGPAQRPRKSGGSHRPGRAPRSGEAASHSRPRWRNFGGKSWAHTNLP